MKQCKQLIGLVILMSSLLACRANVNRPSPDVGMPIQEMNKRIMFRTPDELNNFKTNNIILLEVSLKNKDSQDQVAFKSDFGARLFILQDGKWVEVKNEVTYKQGDGYLFLPTPKNTYPYWVPGVKPALPNPNQAISIRIYVIGFICKDGKVTEEKTGAYLDVDLSGSLVK